MRYIYMCGSGASYAEQRCGIIQYNRRTRACEISLLDQKAPAEQQPPLRRRTWPLYCERNWCIYKRAWHDRAHRVYQINTKCVSCVFPCALGRYIYASASCSRNWCNKLGSRCGSECSKWLQSPMSSQHGIVIHLFTINIFICWFISVILCDL